MKAAEHINSKSSGIKGIRKNFFPGQKHSVPFFSKPMEIQRQPENDSQQSSSDPIMETAPRIFTKPKVFWALENEHSKSVTRVLYSTESTTAEQLAHAIFQNPDSQITALTNVNGVTPDQNILPYSKIKIPKVHVSGTSWAQYGYNSSLRFSGPARNPFPILESMGVSSISSYNQKKRKLDEELKMELPMMAMFIGFGMEDKFLQLLRKYANSNFTDHPDRYVGGGQYVDKIFRYLRGKMKRIGHFGEITSYYDLIFNHFSRANEVRQIRELYSEAYKGDDGIKEVSYGAVFLEEAFQKALSVAGVPKQEIMAFLNKAGDALSEIISKPKKFLKNLMAAVTQGFDMFKTSLPSLLGPGLLQWVLGKVGKGSIEMPKDFSVKSILKLALQSLKLDIKTVVAEVVGPKNKERIEKVWGIVQTLMSKGIGGLVDQLVTYAGDLKNSLLARFKEWLIKDVVKSAISELLQMFIPGGGLVKVIKKIYRVIQFVRNKLAELKNLFISVGQSVLQIVKGEIPAAASKVNQVLKDGFYLLLDLLARLLKVNFLDGIREAIQKLGNTIKGVIKKLVQKIAITGKGVLKNLKQNVTGIHNPSTLEEEYGRNKARKISKGILDLKKEEKKYITNGNINRDEAELVATAIRSKHSVFTSFRVIDGGDSWDYFYTASAGKKVDTPSGKEETIQGAIVKDNILKMNDGSHFSPGDQIQIAKGKGWKRGPYFIISFSEIIRDRTSYTSFTYGKRLSSVEGKMSILGYPRTWRKPIEALDDLPAEVFEKEKTKELWNDRTVAKKILNYRVHGVQHVNPRGKDWEHIVEASTGGEHSSENLVLADSQLNNRLGAYYTTVRRYPELAMEDIVEPIALRDYLKNKSAKVQKEWKLKIYSKVFKVGLSNWRNKGRGRYKELK